ncbi:hypothetical protein Barb6XT_02139 [Bacteroidales bacterium Barb6XT]|nr:hypothetical protein Barb6XT_02139 [Bacteroidales bacterium Barb6XT]
MSRTSRRDNRFQPHMKQSGMWGQANTVRKVLKERSFTPDRVPNPVRGSSNYWL